MRTVITLTVILLIISLPCAAQVTDIPADKLKRADRFAFKGGKALETGNAEKAREFFEKSLEALPEFADAHTGLGHLAMSERKFELALEEYRKAHDGYLKMGHALEYRKMEQFQEIQERISDLRNRIASSSASRGSRQNVAIANPQVASMRSELTRLEAIPRPKQGVVEVPADIHFFLGNALLNLGRMDEAIAEWETCTEKDPSFAPVYNNLAVAYWRAGRLEEAKRYVARAEELGFELNANFKKDLEQSLRAAGLSD